MVVPVILALEPIIVPCAFFLCATALVCCCCGVDKLRRCCNCTGDAEDTSRCVSESSARDVRRSIRVRARVQGRDARTCLGQRA